MAQTVTGSHQIFTYVWEDEGEYNQDPGDPVDDDFKAFGSAETMDTQDRANNPERMYRPFNRGADEIIEQAWEGSWGADFVMTNSWWLQFLYGEPTVTGLESPWAHTYEFHPRSPPRSAHIIEETHYPNGNIEQTVYTGAVVASGDIDVSVEDTVGVSLSGAYAFEETFETDENDDLPYGDTEGGIEEAIGGQPETEYRPLHFGNSYFRLDLDNDNTVEDKVLVQDVSLSLEGNVELENELGTRFPVIPSYLNFEFDVSYTNLVSVDTSTDEKYSSYGDLDVQEPQETLHDANIAGELEFDAGIPGVDNNILFELQDAFPDSFDRSNVGSPEDVIEENIDRMLTNAIVVVTSDKEEPL